MCRHIAYLGSPVTLEALLLTPEHGLRAQARAPRHQVAGRTNTDGFGAGWYDLAVRPEPARYRSPRPIWEDGSFASLAGLVSSGAILAAVRSATPGFPIEETGNAPFSAESWLFSHNGSVDGFRDGADDELRAGLSARRAGGIEGKTDSEVLFALTLDRLDAGASMAEALAGVVRRVKEVSGGRVNLLMTDGRTVAATTAGNSLFALDGDGRAVVASEPHDADPGWRRVPDLTVISGDAAGLTEESL